MNDASHEWAEITGGKAFITDLGFRPPIAIPGEDGGVLEMQRYAAFLPIPGEVGRHQIVEVSGDLAHLQRKYDVPDDRVLVVEAGYFGFGNSLDSGGGGI